MRLVKYPQSQQLSKQLAGAWAAFARDGNPNHAGTLLWPAYKLDQRATMVSRAVRRQTIPIAKNGASGRLWRRHNDLADRGKLSKIALQNRSEIEDNTD